MWIFAHRGDSHHYPENTLAAITSALFSSDADGIEIDVYCTSDKQLVVIHDESLDRTTSGHGYVNEHTYQELCKLDAGSGERIPSLKSVLQLMPSNKWLNIELKGENTATALIELLQSTEYASWQNNKRLIVSSFNHHLLKRIHRAFPTLKIGALTASIPLSYASFAEQLHAWSIHCDKQFVNAELVADAKQRGLKVFAYTVDSPRDIHKLAALGVDAIFSNHPQHAKIVLEHSSI